MPVHTLPIHDDGTFKFFSPTSFVPHETEPQEDSILSVASLDNEMSLDAPPVSDSSPVPTSAQPDPPLRSVRSRQPPAYLKHYHCPTFPHVANLVQSDSKLAPSPSSAVLSQELSPCNVSASSLQADSQQVSSPTVIATTESVLQPTPTVIAATAPI
ncbi:hypothetical protein LWI29_015466 [Acer saccharum]|uniref:Uncharacterized protein n=1 Tax=Acer saccharum TaxID=4024 RepID=A0AA39V7S4_ACESA|nr:hypothetical protein LWI29_015466 [Acer saccharum]